VAQNNRFLLDASALIALVLAERGSKIIETIFEKGEVFATPIAVAESIGVIRLKRGKSPQEVFDSLVGLGLFIVELTAADVLEIDFIQRQGEAAAQALGKPRQLSMADAACLAVGFRLQATVIYSDSFWEKMSLPGIDIIAFR
jgi:PIN domain nuclease of toxin-antitoxin system